ncbi:Polygalacturonase QRT3 [Apostasia shenzhenica]|uniref:Polygalacturonase QRT3 n=1 Tax=Apostasia shenzhenica TaxID=1088818 RepID=A0A2I0AKJ4_9ASPA|nr:Polygalacturonase QRT3 [Apostasia shenzhenica]
MAISGNGGELRRLPLLLALVAAVLSASPAGACQHLGGATISDHQHFRRWDFLRHRSDRLSISGAPSASPPWLPPPPPSISISHSRIFHVTDYGADPTGATDSSPAISRAISAAFNYSSGLQLMPGIPNLGGAEIHLDGGVYLLNSPITFPSTGGNLKIHGGSLRASDDFPANRYIIELQSYSPSSGISPSAYHYEFVTLSGLMLDANFRGGGIAVVNSLRTLIDGCYIVHFTSDGISVHGGHETFIRSSFLGQYITAGGDHREKTFSGTGIRLMGNDNSVTDVVIFSAETGILIAGAANTITGVHCYNKATAWGGVGIHVKVAGRSQTRILNSYMDFTGILAEDPVQLVIAGCYFLGNARVTLRSVNGVMRGVNIVDNIFSGSGYGVDIVGLDESSKRFVVVDGVVVERNSVEGMRLRSTAATASVEGKGTTWTVDFSSVLLFENRIDQMQYTLAPAESTFTNHALRNVSDNRVVIVSSAAVRATVHVSVSQSMNFLKA